MVPAPESKPEVGPPAVPELARGARAALVAVAVGLVLLFAVAVRIDPYEADGRPATMGTHQQLGLPPCNFVRLTGLPCPSCGMTTSFALLVRGDLMNSLRANAVGTLLAIVCLAYIPWSLACVVAKRSLFIGSMDRALLMIVFCFVVLMMFRWGIVLLMMAW
jgi:phosphotransferase system  glucose/maltose/N-acetylglucosamine-specific IIC component